MSKLSSIFNLWGPTICGTFLAYFLGKGAFDGIGQAFERSWASTLQWSIEPVFYPRWVVLVGVVSIFIGGVYLFWKQYKRMNEVEKSHHELITALDTAFKEAAENLQRD
ncbi:hypothetical protein [Pseudomonas haemolytica]|uniref:Uncharacterized protein n=1 Tax=Pseudomonas haemolytica TaxID=2600065 RepID=A0A5P1D9Q0_9PSED|nr:hypothetical protein [Pseudomonas haemolytica]MBJ2245326.1 hypothetical protein [Pseudomonas haemolytica]MBJ2272688.1 hypothetical protein [Pseudomonas haemolytica]MBK3446998.1 hypothetical protein [Pseudomonas haemolytica]MBK3458494.1 hypothetical protein [Pseudomonas haemolytica]MRJ37152.1 hypothetical protein [Pseudomonas haemolytica]